MIEVIGTNAGAIWNALTENGTLTTKELKKATKIKTDKELYLALGWLLREDKLNVVEDGKELNISLK